MGIAIGIGIFVIGLIGALVMNRKPQQKQDPEPVLCTFSNMQGHLLSIVKDASGLSCVTVRDNQGRILYGFSSLSKDQLERIYGGQDWIQIPLVKPPEGRAYRIEQRN